MSTPAEAVDGTAAVSDHLLPAASRSSRPIISSAPSSAAWATARAPCTSSPSPARRISRWTISSWARCTSVLLGAALGTTLSQALSVAHRAACHPQTPHRSPLQKSDLRPQKAVMGQILRIGLPVLAAGRPCADRLSHHHDHRQPARPDRRGGGWHRGEVHLASSSSSRPRMLSTVSALGAQNHRRGQAGAGRGRRLWDAICPGPRLRRRGGHRDPVLRVGVSSACSRPTRRRSLPARHYLRGYIFDCMFAGIHFSFSGYFCACGKSGLSFLHNILAIVLIRVPGAYLMSRALPADAVAHGPRHSRRFALLGHPLHAALPRPRPA